MTGQTENHPMKAALLMLGAMLLIGYVDNLVPKIAQHVSVWQFQFLRSCIALPLVLIVSLMGSGTVWPKRWWPVLGRSFFIACAMLLYFGALGFMSLAEALAGLFTSPLFILLISIALMGRRIGPMRIAAVIIGFVGILLVLQPDPASFDVWLFMPVLAGLFYAIGSIATRSWCEGESTLSLLAGVMLMQGVLGGLVVTGLTLAGSEGTSFLSRPWSWEIPDIAGPLLAQAVVSVGAVWMIIRAYQLEDASFVSVFEYSVMIFGPAFALMLFGVVPGFWQIVGIACIAGAGIVINLRSSSD